MGLFLFRCFGNVVITEYSSPYFVHSIKTVKGKKKKSPGSIVPLRIPHFPSVSGIGCPVVFCQRWRASIRESQSQ